MSVNTSSSTPMGSYPLMITATSGNLTHSTQVTLAVADFSIAASPSSQTVSGNSKTTYTVTVTALGPFSATVNFSVSGLPARTSATFSPTSVVGSVNTKLNDINQAESGDWYLSPDDHCNRRRRNPLCKREFSNSLISAAVCSDGESR